MSNIIFKNVSKVYEPMSKKDRRFLAVDNFNLEIKDEEFIVFVGPSGCGKSTTLRMLAGLEEITSGEIYINDVLVNKVHPKNRNIAMVFQNYALYPHMTVFQNMAFGLKIKHLPKDEIKKKVLEAAEILDITSLLDRKPKALSGGQRQRVALGRAIVRDPAVFLMDEPLSNLDAKLRVQMRTEITKLHKRLKATVIYVTHDQVEAMTMGSRIVVMNRGVIQQIDSPVDLFRKPANMFVAGFIGSPAMNFFEATLKEDSGNIVADIGGAKILLTPDRAKKALDGGYVSKKFILGIRPEHIHYFNGEESSLTEGQLAIVPDMVEVLGSEELIYFKLNDKDYCAKTVESNVKVGNEVRLTIDVNKVHLFDLESGKTITN